MDICLGSRKGDHNHAGLVATAMRVVNAIPAVVAAPPGIVTTLDLPLITGKGCTCQSDSACGMNRAGSGGGSIGATEARRPPASRYRLPSLFIR